MKHVTYLLIALMSLNLWAQDNGDLSTEMDALGANRDLMRKAKAIDPKNKVRVVQNREVSRTMRFEVDLDYGMALGGDPYVKSDVLGGQLNFHITPRFSIGGRYYDISNSLNSEGKAVFEDAKSRNNNNYRAPAVAYADDAWLAVANWYPVYGKLSLFEKAISQFDLYLLAGAGQINLDTGSTPLYTAGGGAGIWLTQHIATRLEARWQGYKDQPGRNYGYNINRDINQTILTATVGFLF